MEFTFYGHACFGVYFAGKHLLFDPFITPNEQANHIDVDAVPADIIFVTHGHQDHIADVEVIAKRTGAMIISSFEIVQYFAGRGFETSHPMNIGGSFGFDFGRVKMVKAVHTNSLPDGSPTGGAPCGFVIEGKDGCFYHSGDTALHLDMQLLAQQFSIDVAMLCIGDNFTMGIDDAVKAAEFIGCDTVLGMHYDTFPPITIDHAAAKAAFAHEGRALHLLEIGEGFILG